MPKIPAHGLWLQAINSCLSFCFCCLYSDTLFPFIRSAFSPIGFLARKRFLTRSAIFLYICHCPAFCYFYCHCSAFCHLPQALFIGHVGQFLSQPHALASWLRGCVRVTRTSIRDDPLDPADIHSRDMHRGRLYSCIYTWLRARHPSRQDNRNKIDFYVSTPTSSD